MTASMTLHYNPEDARAGYYKTIWPSEHTDLWRSHTVLDAGLPIGFDPSGLQVSHTDVDLPVWGYTRNRDEVFVIGGSPVIVDLFTEMILAGKQIPIGDIRGQEGGGRGKRDHIPIVAKIDPSTMNKSVLKLEYGKTINYTGGMLMHANGYVYAVAQSVLYKIDAASLTVAAYVELPLVGTGSQQFYTTYNGMQVIASGEIVIKGFDLTDNSVSGWLLLVDPDDLSFTVQRSAQVSSPRLTIDQQQDGTAFLYLLNAETSTRWLIDQRGFTQDDKWTAQYLTKGSTQASSPVFLGNQIVFSDNTAPIAATPMKLFSQPVVEPPPTLAPQSAFEQIKPGINFFMIGGDPFITSLVVVFDPINGYVAAHRLLETGQLDPVWEKCYKMSASPAIVPDRDFLYIDDYDYNDGHDYFVVLSLKTGSEVARVRLAAKEPTVGCIFVGMNQDVFILSTETGGETGYVSRIFLPAAAN